MDKIDRRTTQADALVIFGATGDLAYKMIFPALYAMTRRGLLSVPVVGVAASNWSLAQLPEHARGAIAHAGKIDDHAALDQPLSLLRYVDGDYNDPGTFLALKQALGEARHPAYYLAITVGTATRDLQAVLTPEQRTKAGTLMGPWGGDW